MCVGCFFFRCWVARNTFPNILWGFLGDFQSWREEFVTCASAQLLAFPCSGWQKWQCVLRGAPVELNLCCVSPPFRLWHFSSSTSAKARFWKLHTSSSNSPCHDLPLAVCVTSIKRRRVFVLWPEDQAFCPPKKKQGLAASRTSFLRDV